MTSSSSRRTRAAALAFSVAAWWQYCHSEIVQAGEAHPVAGRRAQVKAVQAASPAQRAAISVAVRIEADPHVPDPDAGLDAGKACGVPVVSGDEPWARWVNLSGPRVRAKSSGELVP